MRRALTAALVAVAASLVACSGGGDKPDRSIAILRSSPIPQANQDAFVAELAEAGWVVGENLTVFGPDVTEAYPDPDDAAAAVRGWVEDGADLVLALSTTAAMAAARSAGDVPVLVVANDPVASGIVTNPRQPEGNVTGMSFLVPPDRTIDVARRLAGDGRAVGLLWPADDAGAEPAVEGLTAAAVAFDVDLVDATFTGDGEVAAAVELLAAADVGALVLANAPATVRAFAAIEAAATAARLPVIANTSSSSFAVAVLAPDGVAAYRQLGRQAARLLGGTDVADVPLEDPGSFHLLVRTSVADRLGISVPEVLLDQADEVEG